MKRLKPTDVKVIMSAQDPYTEERHADGRAFDSKARDCPLSAHRLNLNGIQYDHILPKNEYVSDYSAQEAQGVLMPNISLTTKVKESRAHASIWRGVMPCAFQLIPKESVAVLLGADARSILSSLNSKEVVEHMHPAARTDEFMDEDLFGKINASLGRLGFSPIDWNPGPAKR
jgi:uracil-DNA glycosylase